MTNEDTTAFGKLAGQVNGLKVVIKSLVAMQLSSMVKEEADFSRMAELARSLSERLQSHVLSIAAEADRRGVSAPATITSMRETVARCFDEPADQMTQVARIVLDLAKPPTDATH